jgi:2-hydroxychromene-2-carboxylate isomerase
MMASSVTKVTFFYDFISPYSYLAFRQLKRLRTKYGGERLQVSYKPVVFGALLTHWSNKGPAEIPPKREFVFRDVYRCAASSLPSTAILKQRTYKIGYFKSILCPSA